MDNFNYDSLDVRRTYLWIACFKEQVVSNIICLKFDSFPAIDITIFKISFLASTMLPLVEGSPKDEITELEDGEVRNLIQGYNFEHPLLQIGQNQEVFYPFAGYCRIGLEQNGFIQGDGHLDSHAVFNPEKFKKINEIGRWQFAMGSRGCVGETLAIETLTWDALCMAYLLKKFPGMKIIGETKTKFGLFMGKEFTVRNLAQVA